LPLLMAQMPASAAPVRKAPAARPAASAAVVKPTRDIIPLPLNPMLPAGQRLCEAKTEAGLGYTMLRPAAGPMPAEADYVLVNYIGYLAATGAVFDQGKAAKFPVNGVIPGFSKGLQMLGKGGIARFCIPAAMGYGAQESGPIPPIPIWSSRSSWSITRPPPRSTPCARPMRPPPPTPRPRPARLRPPRPRLPPSRSSKERGGAVCWPPRLHLYHGLLGFPLNRQWR
jgi:FKBP-type peptidyl-prolyl cis-trans isomerase FkpA